MRLVFDEQASPLVSSCRKVTYRARYVSGKNNADGDVAGGNAGVIPVVAVFFSDRRAFEKEFEKLELAGHAGVGPRMFDVCHLEKPQTESARSAALSVPESNCPEACIAPDTPDRSATEERNAPKEPGAANSNATDERGVPKAPTANETRGRRGATFPCLVEEDLGVSLADMISKNAAAPHVGSGHDGVRLAPVGSAARAQQAAKIAFDIGAELAALHAQGAFYLDLKPSNVCVRAYGNGPADIRAGLIDFESLVTSNRPSDYSTFSCYGALCTYARGKGVAAPMLTNMVVDLGFLLLVTACALRGKTVRALSAADIDAACALPGMSFFAIRYGYFDVRPLDESDLAALAEFAGMARVSERTPLPTCIAANAPGAAAGNLDQASDGKPAPERFDLRNAVNSQPAFGRFGFYDAVDELRAAQDPLYVLAKRKFDIALACHADWRGAADQTRSDLIDDFFAQDPVKIKQGLRQADGILSYIARLGCTLVPERLASLPRYRGRRVRQLNCGQVLLVAQWEHESWRALHEQLGFHYAERNPDGTRPTSANEYLLPWDDLCATPETDGAPVPVGIEAACGDPAAPTSPSSNIMLAQAPHNDELAKLMHTRARNDIAFACGIIDKLHAIGLAVVSEGYQPPSLPAK